MFVHEGSDYVIAIDTKDGSIRSFLVGGRECIAPLSLAGTRSSFHLRFLRQDGTAFDLASDDFPVQKVSFTLDSLSMQVCFSGASSWPGAGAIEVVMELCFLPDRVECGIKVRNDTGLILEWIDYPGVVVPDDLGTGPEDAKLFWPAMEGCVVEDACLREQTWLRYRPMGYPSKGYEGYYPGPCQMQFMASWDSRGGLYLAAEDSGHNLKSIEWRREGGGIRLEYRLFAGSAGKEFRMPYPMVLAPMHGDWQDAADRYRLVMGKAGGLPTAFARSSWLDRSPVVIIYPVRGRKDTGDMSPNEYFPYPEALHVMDRLSESLASPVMALLMHWEGTAPWAPPFAWPPYGGEESLQEFARQLHGKGNLLGLYCSGIGWTNESHTDPSYTRRAEFDEKGLATLMCAAPDGSVPDSLICNGPAAQRSGHDLCPAAPGVVDMVVSEVKNILASGCDYVQYFDQNLGGASYLCYSSKHGHPAAPGRAQVVAMEKLCHQVVAAVEEPGADGPGSAADRTILIGCESAAAEPYAGDLVFNDLRYEIHFAYARPVPAYAYVMHDRVVNFMGNQNCCSQVLDHKRSPEHLQFRLAYSFAAGDLLALSLGAGGRVLWDWGGDWDGDYPDQDGLLKLAGNLNAWRLGIGSAWLRRGRALKPWLIEGAGSWRLYRRDGSWMDWPRVLSARWGLADGGEAQFLVNYRKEAVSCRVHSDAATVLLCKEPELEAVSLNLAGPIVPVTVPPLSVVMLQPVRD